MSPFPGLESESGMPEILQEGLVTGCSAKLSALSVFLLLACPCLTMSGAG